MKFNKIFGILVLFTTVVAEASLPTSITCKEHNGSTTYASMTLEQVKDDLYQLHYSNQQYDHEKKLSLFSYASEVSGSKFRCKFDETISMIFSCYELDQTGNPGRKTIRGMLGLLPTVGTVLSVVLKDYSKHVVGGNDSEMIISSRDFDIDFCAGEN